MHMCNQITNISTLSNNAKTVRMEAIKHTPLKADPARKKGLLPFPHQLNPASLDTFYALAVDIALNNWEHVYT